MRFPVHIGAIPQGNVIVIAENPASLPAGLNLPAVNSPTVAMRTNPNDPVRQNSHRYWRQRRRRCRCCPGHRVA